MPANPLPRLIAAQRGHLFPWVPVCLGAGIGAYFAMPVEPPAGALWAAGVGAMCLALLARRAGETLAPFLLMLMAVSAGYGLAGARAHLVAAPLLDLRYYGPIEGRVVIIDRSASEKTRLTLDEVVLLDIPPERMPRRVRVSLHHDRDYLLPVPGMRVATTGHLSAPEGPVEPGGFDFRRMAWFDGIGAVGYSRVPLVMTAPAPDGWGDGAIGRLRMAISRGVQDRLPGETGAFAAAILTGDRSGIGAETLQDLRDTNLAHLLAISGLHMGLLTGFVFASLRLLMALWPRSALTWPTKKIAAVGAILAGAAYYALSGGNVATERAFIMVTVALVAVLADRRALTLRAVAIAALIVLGLRPETVTEPGFQMSFAATTALVGVFSALRERTAGLPKWARPAFAVIVSSSVAGAATAPYAAAHFNRLSDYGLIANLATVPLMGALVMPAAVLAACLWPLGLSGIGLWAMRWPIDWILTVANRVAVWEGAVTPVPSPPGTVLPLVTLGGLCLILWRGQGRWVGLVPVVAALALWLQVQRPAILISPDGGLIGVMAKTGRALSKPRGQGFAARVWLENDGDAADQAEAAERWAARDASDWLEVAKEGFVLRQVTGRTARARLDTACAGAAVVVTTVTEPEVTGDCRLYGPNELARTGAIAIHLSGDGVARIVTAADRSGYRLWNAQ